jgi:hypothetical protein
MKPAIIAVPMIFGGCHICHETTADALTNSGHLGFEDIGLKKFEERVVVGGGHELDELGSVGHRHGFHLRCGQAGARGASASRAIRISYPKEACAHP